MQLPDLLAEIVVHHVRESVMRMLNHRWTCLLFAQICLLANLPAAMADETTPVRFHVVDADSNTPLPCRVYLRSAAGTDYHVKSADTAGSAVTYDVKRSAESFEKHMPC